MKIAEAAIDEEILKLLEKGVSETELEKVKNKTESAMVFEDIGLANRASSIAIYELLGDASLVNTELDKYKAVTTASIAMVSKEILMKITAAHYITFLKPFKIFDEQEISTQNYRSGKFYVKS